MKTLPLPELIALLRDTYVCVHTYECLLIVCKVYPPLKIITASNLCWKYVSGNVFLLCYKPLLEAGGACNHV